MEWSNNIEDRIRHPERWLGLQGTFEQERLNSASSYLTLWLSEPKLERVLSHELAARFNENTDAYDRAIDSVYNETRIGGALQHHNLDGQHTLSGAMDALRQAFPGESDFSLFTHASDHLVRDLTTYSGINPWLTPQDYSALNHSLQNHFSLSSTEAHDLLNLNAVEAGAAVTGTFTILFALTRHEEQDLGRYVGRLSVASIFAANPLLLSVVAAAGAVGIIRLWSGETDTSTIGGAIEGGLSAGAFFGAATLAGTPILGLLLGTIASIGASAVLRTCTPEMFMRTEDVFSRYFPKLRIDLGVHP